MKFLGYKTYRFKDKDPVIDVLREAIRIAGWSLERVSLESGVPVGTLYAWFHGDTRYPRHCGVQAVAKSLGKELVMMERPALRSRFKKAA